MIIYKSYSNLIEIIFVCGKACVTPWINISVLFSYMGNPIHTEYPDYVIKIACGWLFYTVSFNYEVKGKGISWVILNADIPAEGLGGAVCNDRTLSWGRPYTGGGESCKTSRFLNDMYLIFCFCIKIINQGTNQIILLLL